jgi:FG-GAP-like repeat/FG-GAP repeat
MRPSRSAEIVLSVFALLCNVPRAIAQQFSNSTKYPVGAWPVAVAAGHLNRDGKLDLIVGNSDSSNVSVLLGNGDGSFQSAVNYALERHPAFLCLADLNGDQKLDIVLADDSASTVTVLLGNGDGTFRPAARYDAGSVGQYIVVADFNNDMKPDLLVSNDTGFSILLGNGEGTFQAPFTTSFQTDTPYIAVGDFNGDGRLDVAGAKSGVNRDEGYSGNLSVLLGNGDGTFLPANTQPVGFLSRFFLTGDFNGDGEIDLAVSTKQSLYGGGVLILLGDGKGGFQLTPNPEKPVGSYGFDASLLAAADANGDGKADILGLEFADPESLPMRMLTFLANGNGTFRDVQLDVDERVRPQPLL